MAKFFGDIEDKFDDFFTLNYVAQDKFYVKVKANKFVGEVKMKGDNPELKAKFKHNAHVQDFKVDAEVALSSSGKHKFIGEWDLKDTVKDVEVKHTTNWNSQSNDHDTLVALQFKGVDTAKLGLDFQYFRNGHWEATPHLAKEIQKGLSSATDFTWDGKTSEIKDFKVGIEYEPNNWSKTWLSHHVGNPLAKDFKLGKIGSLSLCQRFNASLKTQLGFDYNYNLNDKSSTLQVGIETSPAAGLTVKSKINSEGSIEAAAKIDTGNGWDVLVALATHSASISGKQEAQFGVGIEGKL
jgi:hypothetical protein